MLTRILLSSAAAALVLTGAASAQPAQPAPPDASTRAAHARAKFEERFNAADTDHDGMLSREEAQRGMPNVYKHFDEIDTAKRGQISKEEIAAFMAKLARQRRAVQGGN